MADEVPITVTQLTAYMPISQELVEDHVLPPFDELVRQIEENARAFAALPPQEQERILAERKARYEADRCVTCGCHPDEHANG